MSRHQMPGLLVRWWRWWVNPEPCEGEVWVAPSLGAVEIVKVDPFGYVRFRTQGGREFEWPGHRFRERATFGPPSASALIGQGDP